jgi:hypothetical protein
MQTGARARLLLLLLVLAWAATLIAGSSAYASRPRFVSFTVHPKRLGAAGGWVTFRAKVHNAVSCTLEGVVGRDRTVACSSGRVSIREFVPPNRGRRRRIYSAHIEAHNGAWQRRSLGVQIELAAHLPVAPNVTDLEECRPGPDCDYGYAYEHFKTWGNAAPEALGDCTFAAAANWEQVINRFVPFEADLGYEFAEAGGTATGGLSVGGLFSYWEKNPIGGVKLAAWERFALSKANVEKGVRDFGALYAELDFLQGDYFAQYEVSAGGHAAVVIGFTPEGPLVASWGAALQMTWEQWEDEAIGMWALETTKPT